MVPRGSVVFLANSATDRWHENQQCYRELQGHLLAQQLDPATIPMVMQYNKRDLPADQSLADWTQQTIAWLSARPSSPEARATRRSSTVDLPEDARFGTEASAQHMLKLAMLEAIRRTAPDARSSDVLAEAYAQASTELGVRVNDLRAERDVARSRLAELKLALAEQPPGEGEIEDRAQRILSILMRSAEAANASLLLTTTDPPQIMVLRPLVSDPLARTSWGAVHLYELRELAERRLEDGRARPELATTLAESEPVFESVALVPLRSAERVLALGILHYRPHMALPRADTLEHLGFLGRIRAGPLEAVARARPRRASIACVPSRVRRRRPSRRF